MNTSHWLYLKVQLSIGFESIKYPIENKQAGFLYVLGFFRVPVAPFTNIDLFNPSMDN